MGRSVGKLNERVQTFGVHRILPFPVNASPGYRGLMPMFY